MKLLSSRNRPIPIELNDGIDSHTGAMGILPVRNVKPVFTTLHLTLEKREFNFPVNNVAFPGAV